MLALYLRLNSFYEKRTITLNIELKCNYDSN